MVFNCSWPLFPYIWNEIKFYIAYDTDLEFVSRTMQKISEEEMGEEMMERVAMFRELLAKTPVDELEVRERPRVIFRVNENTWLEAIVRYLVPPTRSGFNQDSAPSQTSRRPECRTGKDKIPEK
jgi:small-conductance mechanosensitive channel